ncbi:MAG TPA: hypothetical protein VFS24_05410, partial [Steroidobacteraceae bacterium]|nr:hypothetical protein [Steroidobacteraceae bacterium]
DCNFGTVNPSTGASFTLGGTPAVSIYKDNGTTESTTGVTLTADFDARTGLNHLRVTTASDGTFYSAGSYFEAVITAGTVNSVSVVGQPVCAFTLNKAKVSSVTGSVASIASGGISESSFATTTGSFDALGWTRQGTAQGATSTTVTLDASAPFGDNTNVGGTLWVKGSTAGTYWQPCLISGYVASTKVATVSCASGFVTPTGTITYKLAGTAPSSGGSGLDANGVRTAIGLASANLDTQLSTIAGYVDTEVAAIKTKTDFLPSATAGAAGGVFIAGTNAATSITTGLTANITGNVSGSVGSVTGNVGGNVTGSVGSVTGNVGGTVNGLTVTAQGNVRTALGLASANLDTQLSGLSSAIAAIDTVVNQLLVGVNVKQMNGHDVCGSGTSADKWTACP